MKCWGIRKFACGEQFSPWEGGIRVNAFVSGGYVPQNRRGQREEGMLHIADWYSTLLTLVGLDPTDARAAKAGLPPIDSLDMWPMISGVNSTSPRYELAVDQHTLIQGKYKFYNGTTIKYAAWGSTLYPNSTSPDSPIEPVTKDCSMGCLFDIIEDPTEHVDVIDENEVAATTLNARLEELKKGYYS